MVKNLGIKKLFSKLKNLSKNELLKVNLFLLKNDRRCIKKNLYKIKNSSIDKLDSNTFWIILRDIAKDEILNHDSSNDGDIIIQIYYEIKKNLEYIPDYYKIKLPSNNQERYRVINRNIFSSNAFHEDGLAYQKGIIANKVFNKNIFFNNSKCFNRF